MSSERGGEERGAAPRRAGASPAPTSGTKDEPRAVVSPAATSGAEGKPRKVVGAGVALGTGSGDWLVVEDLAVRYGEIDALKGISFRVREGEIFTLVGAN